MGDKVIFKIGGMTCTTCAQTIEKAVGKLEGVNEVNVNFGTESAVVDYNAEQVITSRLKKAIKDAGYRVIEERRTEEEAIKRQRRIFAFALTLSIPVFLISMFFKEIPFREVILFALTTPIQFIAGFQFYKGAFAALRNRLADMNVLVALGTSAAYFYSVAATFFIGGKVYYETAALLSSACI